MNLRRFHPEQARPANLRTTRAGTRGFTLIELLVVITIILLVSAVALPTVIPAISHRQVSEAARILQGALAGAHDVAVHTGSPAGIRLIPDASLLSINPATGTINPASILAADRFIPIQPAPDYTTGRVSIIKDYVDPNLPNFSIWTGGGTPPPFPQSQGSGSFWPYPYPPGNAISQGGPSSLSSVLMVEECPIDMSTGLPNEPTSWFWNIRMGDKITIGNSGNVYTVIGPMTVTPYGDNRGSPTANPDMFVNDGPQGQPPMLQRTYISPLTGQPMTFNVEYLFLVDGQDDDNNGFIDDIWDGVDNNVDGLIDNAPAEFTETEAWQGSLANLPLITPTQMVFPQGYNVTGALNMTYTISRRPVPTSAGREIMLPPSVVVDLTSWANPAPERSRIPLLAFNRLNGFVEVLVYPNGQVVPSTFYSTPSSMNLSSSFIHFWLAERSDLVAPQGTYVNGVWTPISIVTGTTGTPSLPIGTVNQALGSVSYTGPTIKGEYRLVTVFSRTGQITTNSDLYFDNPLNPQNGVSYNSNIPYLAIQQGLSGGR